MKNMKAIWFQRPGKAKDVLVYADRPKPETGDGEVLVKLHASAVNPSDVKRRAGAQPAGFTDGFVIPHSDGAGVVEGVGKGVSKSRVGQRVWVYQAQFGRHCGTCAEYISLPENLAAPLPDNADFSIGACAGIPMMTAHRCVFNVGDPKGKTILVTGASGRVGYYAAQWAKQAGARVIATAGSDQRCEVVTETNADHVLNYRNDDLITRINALTEGQGVDHIVDVEFGVNARISAEIIKNCGTISTYSSSLAPQPVIPFYPMMFKNAALNMVLVYNMPDAAKQLAVDDIYYALENNRLKHRIAETWSMEETDQAHESIEAGGRDGCVIIHIE